MALFQTSVKARCPALFRVGYRGCSSTIGVAPPGRLPSRSEKAHILESPDDAYLFISLGTVTKETMQQGSYAPEGLGTLGPRTTI